MGIHGYILMYSVVSRRSFDMVSTIRDKLLNAVGTGCLTAPSLLRAATLCARERRTCSQGYASQS